MTVDLSQMSVSSPRLDLPKPISATLGDLEATITEMGLTSCLARHATRVKVSSTIPLQFAWGDERFRLDAKVVRSTMQFVGGKPVYVSELLLADSVETAPEVVRRIVGSLVGNPPAPEPARMAESVPETHAEVPASRSASTNPESRIPNPEPEPVTPPAPAPPLIYDHVPFLRYDDEAEEPAAPPPFMRCTFAGGRWRRERVSEPAQPESEGFTTLAPPDDEEADALCRTYEVADPETRKMMRFSFELAIERQQRA